MARLFTGEKELKREDILQLLQGHDYGLQETELAEMLGWDRRTANNYLRDLAKKGLIYKDGRLWLAEE
jgi:DNA-binding IclR family transcriptional regulator